MFAYSWRELATQVVSFLRPATPASLGGAGWSRGGALLDMQTLATVLIQSITEQTLQGEGTFKSEKHDSHLTEAR